MNSYKTILDENSVVVYYDSDDNWLYLSWYGEQTLDSRIRAFNQVIDFLKISDCTKVLNDNRHNCSAWSDCALWVANDWLPRAEAEGMRSLAWVYSTDTEARRSAEEMIGHLHGKAIVIPFEGLQDAKSWLHVV
jgi:hypothetical protein